METNTLYRSLCLLRSDDDYEKEAAYKEILNRFSKLIHSYSYWLHYKEAFQDLEEAFYIMLLKIPIEEERFEQDQLIVSYIETSIENEFIRLSKQQSKYRKRNVYFEEHHFGRNLDTHNKYDYIIWLLDITKILTRKEDIRLFELRFIDNYSTKEISEKFGISQQAINKKIRRIKKLLSTIVEI